MEKMVAMPGSSPCTIQNKPYPVCVSSKKKFGPIFFQYVKELNVNFYSGTTNIRDDLKKSRGLRVYRYVYTHIHVYIWKLFLKTFVPGSRGCDSFQNVTVPIEVKRRSYALGFSKF